MARYIEEKDFCDFKQNFHTLIETFNHSMTDLKKDFKETKNKVGKIAEILSEMRGSLKITQKVVWWIAGIIGTVFAAACLANIR